MLRLLIASSRRVNNRNLAPLSAASSKKSPPVQQANEPNPEEHDLYLDPNDNQIWGKVQEAEKTPRDHSADQEIGKVLKHEDDVRNLF